MKTCPACASSFYNTHADGRFKRGYCERCAYESEEVTAEMDAPRTASPDGDLTFKPFRRQPQRQEDEASPARSFKKRR